MAGILRAALTAALAAIAALGGACAAWAQTSDTKNLEDGSWSSRCGYSHTLPDDPIVFPGLPGASHPHDFLGNASTHAHSTHESLLAAPTRCIRGIDMLGSRSDTSDHSAYWVPSLQTPDGAYVRPGAMTAYYTNRGLPLPIEPFPPGFSMIAGDARAVAPQHRTTVFWSCNGGSRGDASPGRPHCESGTLTLTLNFPECWNGEPTPVDGKSHVTPAVVVPGSGRVCPDTHPRKLPRVELYIAYPSAPTGVDLELALDGTRENRLFGGHGDFINAWAPGVQERLVATCINSGRQCFNHG